MLAQFNFRLVVYMDDVLLASYMSPERTQRLLRLLRLLFDLFGITISEDKSVLYPADAVEFLGFVISVDGILALSARRFGKLHGCAAKLLVLHNKNRRFVPF